MQTCPTISVLSIRWRTHVNSCPEIIHSPQGETETVTPSFHSSQIVQSNPLSAGSLGEEGGGNTSRRQGTHFPFNLLSSPRTFLSLISIIIRRFLCFLSRPWQMLHTGEEHESHSVCLFCRWWLSLNLMSQRVFQKPHIQNWNTDWGFTLIILHVGTHPWVSFSQTGQNFTKSSRSFKSWDLGAAVCYSVFFWDINWELPKPEQLLI